MAYRVTTNLNQMIQQKSENIMKEIIDWSCVQRAQTATEGGFSVVFSSHGYTSISVLVRHEATTNVIMKMADGKDNDNISATRSTAQ